MIFKIGDLIDFCNIHMKASVTESSFNEVTRYWIFVRFYLPIDVSPCFFVHVSVVVAAVVVDVVLRGFYLHI